MELIVGFVCVLVAFVIVAGALLSPLLTFLLLFTTLGNVLHRALRGKPLRTAYRFDLRALIVLITFAAVSIGWLKASSYHVVWDDVTATKVSVEGAPRNSSGNHDPWFYFANWLVIAIPISMLLALTRYAIDVYDDRRRPLLPAQAPPSFAGITLPEPSAADSPQDSPPPGE